eukprot:CAMPEP_0185443444 /NCGR_PEP_ID=MMETSP1365-20130426/47258_1 /TAXON_ID=38817 /ORGANISM="Gephyrocapsa oceanica, Strain RCC1303" /LENGTH=33 /DNA_ID= /DNA_START= /DNA_END= /DNA_ORIENTATION=
MTMLRQLTPCAVDAASGAGRAGIAEQRGGRQTV